MDFSLIGRGKKISATFGQTEYSSSVVKCEKKFSDFLFKPHLHLQWVVGVDISPM